MPWRSRWTPRPGGSGRTSAGRSSVLLSETYLFSIRPRKITVLSARRPKVPCYSFSTRRASNVPPPRTPHPMLGRRPRRPSAPELTAPDSVLTLAVYHRSDNVEQHLGELRALAGVRLELVRKGTLWTVPNDVSGILWELSPDDGAHRLVSALIGTIPAVSYSIDAEPAL